MFYVKKRIGDDSDTVEIRIEINDENVFTICPECGAEHNIDLSDFMQFDDVDLYSTKVHCFKCSAKHLPTQAIGE